MPWFSENGQRLCRILERSIALVWPLTDKSGAVDRERGQQGGARHGGAGGEAASGHAGSSPGAQHLKTDTLRTARWWAQHQKQTP
ncbi:jg2074 [Pararge aegeria aegeria]|uniref:Jg2074 protein n=1 Tax=Pararge aegeria aegeria TaxID=348720 RepID=A0A8S4QIA2_9NEOP|nr:jg2074 [Pararge aegeria aegeria]